jgi:hypothetical protein
LLGAGGAIVHGPTVISTVTPGIVYTFNVPAGITARHVQINLPPGKNLEIAELDVFGVPPTPAPVPVAK